MTAYQRTADGHQMTVHAPPPGGLDPAALAAFTAAEPVLGLDVETSALDDRGPRFFAPGFAVRLVQLGTEREAWVLDMADAAQADAATAVLGDPARRFVTHTAYDVLAVWVTLGVPLGQRVADTHLLSKLIDPDERAGHGLKELAGAAVRAHPVELPPKDSAADPLPTIGASRMKPLRPGPVREPGNRGDRQGMSPRTGVRRGRPGDGCRPMSLPTPPAATPLEK